MRVKGFTLLELLVVLLVLALGAAVATPALLRMVDAVSDQNKRDQAIMALSNLPIDVMKSGSEVTLSETNGYVPFNQVLHNRAQATGEDAKELLIWLPSEIRYRTNGACTGGEIHLEFESGSRALLILDPPFCRPRLSS